MTVSALSIRFDAEKFWVDLCDGRTLGVPLSWFPRLCRATPEQRERVEIEQSGLPSTRTSASMACWQAGAIKPASAAPSGGDLSRR